jgi:hypothetical protein
VDKLNSCQSKIDATKGCKTPEQAAQFSQLIENAVDEIRKFCVLEDRCRYDITSATQKISKAKSYIELNKNSQDEDVRKEVETKKKIIINQGKILAGLEGFERKTWEEIQTLFQPFQLDANGSMIKWEELTVHTDNENINCYVYSPAGHNHNQKYPCIIWLHGGDVSVKTNCHYSRPDQLDISREAFCSTIYNFTPGLQPLARHLAANGVAFATITIKGRNGLSNIRQQIKDQIISIKSLDYIDPEKMAIIGHSNGGHIMSQMIANEYEFLNQNFKLGVGLASSYINESWGYDSITESSTCFDSFNGYAFQHAAPNDVPMGIDCSQPIKNFRGEQAKYVYKWVHPFSITSGMSQEELTNIFRQFTIPIFLFVGLKDTNTAPTTQNGTVAWLLNKIGVANWRTFAYAGGDHSPHRIQIKTNESIPEDQRQAFNTMLSDILSIGQGNPNPGTQNLSIFSQNEIVREHSPDLTFSQFENGEKVKVKFKDTECGKDILGLENH